MATPYPYRATLEPRLRETLASLKRKDVELFSRVQKQMDKVLDSPQLGKPLRYHLKNCRRVHVGSFVLLYEIIELRREVHFLEFDHHDKIYKRQRGTKRK